MVLTLKCPIIEVLYLPTGIYQTTRTIVYDISPEAVRDLRLEYENNLLTLKFTYKQYGRIEEAIINYNAIIYFQGGIL